MKTVWKIYSWKTFPPPLQTLQPFPRVLLWEPSQKWSLVWCSAWFLISTWEQISNQSLRGLNKLEYKSPCKPLRTLISWHVCEKREMDSHKPHIRNFQQPIEGYKKLDFCLLGLNMIWPSFRAKMLSENWGLAPAELRPGPEIFML